MNRTISTPAELLEKALFVLKDGFCIVDSNLNIEYINFFALEFLEKQAKCRPETGDNFFDFIPEERQHLHKEFISKAFDHQASVVELEFLIDEERVFYEMDYYPLIAENNLVSHVCIKAKNITDKVLLENKLKEEKRIRKDKLIKATIEAQEKERSLIGRELHDNVNQVLTTVKLYTEICYHDDRPNKELLKRCTQQINYCIEEIRGLSRRLAVPKIEEMDLEDLIRDLVDTINVTKKTSIEFLSYGIKNKKFGHELCTTVYRIVQEQLTNVIKYAMAGSVKVVVAGTSDDLAIQVQDNGIGFDFNQKSNGNGITNMISRAETMGGTIRFETSPGNGCTITAEFPLDKEHSFF